MKKFKKTFLSILVTAFLALATFVGGGALLQNTGANSVSVETDTKTTQKAQTNWDNAKSDYVPDKESAFYAAYNNLSSTEYSEPNENGEYDLAKLGSVVIDLTNFNKSTLASIGLKEDAVDTKANATLSATLEHGKMNIVVSCQYGNRYLEASTDAEAILLEHFTGGAPVKLSGTKILTNTNANKLMAVETYNAKIAKVTEGTLTFSNAVYGGADSNNRITGRGIYMSGGSVNLSTECCIKCYNAYALSSGKGGGGVWMNGGGGLTFTGGTIYDCCAENGGGVYADNSGNCSIYLNPGTIENCAAYSSGGGVYTNGAFGIKDGSINGNYCTYGNGGGVYMADDGRGADLQFVMSGGNIGRESDTLATSSSFANKAAKGGGVYLKEVGYYFDSEQDTPYIKGNYSTGDGGGIYFDSILGADHQENMTFPTVAYNLAGGNGGGVYNNAANMELESFYINGNKSNSKGGGIYSQTTIDMGSIVSNNQTNGGDGGGVYVAVSNGGSGTLYINGSANIYSNNTNGGDGGGVYVGPGFALSMSGGTIASNWGFNGGGIYVDGGANPASCTISAGTIGASVSSLSGCASDSSHCSNYAAQNGGGIYFNSDGGDTVSLSISGVYTVIGYNYADVYGGGIYCTNQLSIGSRVSVVGNFASRGGGIYKTYDTTFSITGSNVKYNKAGAYGGGIMIYSSSVSNSFTSSTGSTGQTFFIENNKCDTGPGGGIYCENAGLSLSGGYIRGNEADTNGGGIYITSSSDAGERTLTVGSAYIGLRDSRADSANWSNCANGSGGGIYVTGFVNLTLNSATVSGNYAQSYGGGIYFSSQTGTTSFTSSLSISSATISYNTSGSYGGGLYYAPFCSSLTMSSGTFTYNKASRGGAMYLAPNTYSSVSITGGTIGTSTAITSVDNAATNLTNSSNHATQGGGIYVNSTGAGITIAGAAIRYNYADYGGGMYMASSTTVTLRSTVNGNGAQAGAGIYQYGTLNLSYSGSVYPNVTYNKASSSGGGIYSNAGTLNYSGSSTSSQISYNQANNGGGIYAYNATVNLSGGQIRSNNAVNNSSGGYGGGIYFKTTSASRTLTMSASSVYIGGNSYAATGPSSADYNSSNSGNRAESFGGGVYIVGASGYAATMNLNAGYVASNVAGSSGGGIYVDQYATVNVGVNNSSASNAQYISANYAGSSGGGVFITGSAAKFYMSSGYLGRYSTTLATDSSYSNRAPNGAGLYLNGSASSDVRLYSRSSSASTYYAHVYGNYSTGNGGGIYSVASGYLYLYGYTRIQYNKAGASNSVYGSGVYYAGGSYMSVGGYIKIDSNYSYNSAYKKGDVFLGAYSSKMRYVSSPSGTLYSSASINVYKTAGSYGTAEDASYILYSTDSSSRTNALTCIKAYIGTYPTPITLAESGNYIYMSAKPAYYSVTISSTPARGGSVSKSQTYTPSGAELNQNDFWQSTGLNMENGHWLWKLSATSVTVSAYSGTTYSVSGSQMTFTYNSLTYATASASANSGYTFDSWGSTSGTITAAKTIYAYFIMDGMVQGAYDIGSDYGNHVTNVGDYVKRVEKQLWIDEKQRILGTKHPWIVSVDDDTDTDKLVV